MNTGTVPVVATITVSPIYSSGGVTCTGPSKTFTITVNPRPTVNFVNNQLICNGDATSTVTFGGSVAGTVYLWTNNTPSIGLGANGSGDIGAFSAVNNGSSPVTATITVTPSYTNGGATCTGNPRTFTITVNPTAQVNTVASQVVCNGLSTVSVTFSTSNTGGSTLFNWTNDNTSIGLSSSGTGNIPSFTAINTGSAPVTATITVTPIYTNAGLSCSGPAKTFTITVNPTPRLNLIPNQVVCTGGGTTPVVFSSNVVVGTVVYNWTNNTTSIGLAASGAGNIASFATVNTGTAPVTATITVTPSYTYGSVSCDGPAQSFTITVNPEGQVNTPTSRVVCNGIVTTAVTFSTNNTGGTATYSWANDNTSIGLAANGVGPIPSFMPVNAGAIPVSAVITVTPIYTNAGVSCTGAQKTFIITVNPTAQVNPVNSQVVCHGGATSPVTFGGSVPGTEFSWTNDNTSIGIGASGIGNIPSFTALNTGLSPITATITVTPSYTNAGVKCTGTPKTFTITINPTATVNALQNIQFCGGERTNPINFSSPNSGGVMVYNWTNSNTAIGLPASGVGSIPAFTAINASPAPINATITVTPVFVNGSITCPGISRAFTITVYPLPQAQFRVTPDSACAPMIVTFSNLTQFADTFQWLLNGSLFSTSVNPPPMILSQGGANHVFTLIAGNSQGGCGPVSYTYTVKTLPTPRAQFALNGSLSDTLYSCKELLAQASNTSYLNLPGNLTGLSYQWYVNGQLQSTVSNPQIQLNNFSHIRDTLIKIKLVVASNSGCIDSTSRWVRLYPEPRASFAIVGGSADCARPRSGLLKTVINQSLVKSPASYT
ncbi:MAG: beta strand repeat-containing protein, partial [Sphaerospermopsis kisseleviana]